jgi:hypothetical protein
MAAEKIEQKVQKQKRNKTIKIEFVKSYLEKNLEKNFWKNVCIKRFKKLSAKTVKKSFEKIYFQQTKF